MSKPRKSSAALTTREKARAKAEEITRRNEELIELAAGFFVHEDHLAQIEDESEKNIAQLPALAEEKKATAKQDAEAVVAKMLAIGESKKSIGERPGLSTAELEIYLPVAPTVDDTDAPKAGTEDPALAGSGLKDSVSSAVK
ncbi:hypothetical protein [Glutamicibacter ardleyensis]|uniref:hypothetical protein n=1 Tax=Glutamicibacter ardleyensis TaxID=225894 RepID=UPI003FD62547